MNKITTRVGTLPAILCTMFAPFSRASDVVRLTKQLIYAAQEGKAKIIKRLHSAGADLNAQSDDREGTTALLQAARYGHKGVVQLLLDQGVHEDQIDKLGWTALMHAAQEGRKAVTRLLLSMEADVHLQTWNGSATALHWATYSRKTTIIQLLLDADADANVQDSDGATPLMSAAAWGDKTIICLLLEAEADIALTDNIGRTALHRAALYGQTKTVKLLLDAGADVDQQDEEGETALMTATELSSIRVVQLLLQAGADVNHTNTRTESVLMKTACKRHDLLRKSYYNHDAMVRMLFERGAHLPTPEQWSLLSRPCWAGDRQRKEQARTIIQRYAPIVEQRVTVVAECLERAYGVPRDISRLIQQIGVTG